jgi:hypothetical protein
MSIGIVSNNIRKKDDLMDEVVPRGSWAIRRMGGSGKGRTAHRR